MMPLSDIHAGMVVPVWREGQIVESVVEEVTRDQYEGPVYDLSIPNTRNYIAADMVVHNSIYAWRGADIRNILDFEKDYPSATVVRLEQNYRSTKMILRIASDLIARNSQRKDKRLWTENIEGEKAAVLLCQDEHHEAQVIAQRLQRLHDQGKYTWNKMAVFYRINALSRVMEDALRRANIPYQIARGVEFYNRKEIKDVLAYLRVIANPDDAVSLNRIVNVPPRALGATTIKQLEAWGIGEGMGLWDSFTRAGEAPGLSKRAAGAARQFVELVRLWQQMAVHPPIGSKGRIQSLMEDVVNRSGLEAMLRKIGDKELAELANVNELINSAAEFDNENPDGSLVDYLAMVSLVSDADRLDGGEGAVTMMTLHAAKGLEFPVVAMIGMEEGILPHSRARESRDDLEEERRLCFVGITRAQERLLFAKATTRTIRGLRERTITSPFLSEMPQEALAIEDLADFSSSASFAPAATRDETKGDFRKGQLVRHPSFGLGRITDLSDMGRQTRAIVQFNSAGRKTLILEYARLTAVEG
jgi:DNA helicase-2/ATP-dependent DNA helicase PcrA